MDIKKIIMLSDTHTRLSESCIKALNSMYSKDDIYESKIFCDGEYKSEFLNSKDSLNEKKPDLIIHAGDIGSQQIIEQIQEIAPLIAVNGNCDFNSYYTNNGPTNDAELFKLENLNIILMHIPYDLEQWDKHYDADLYLHGHTHEPYMEKLKDGHIWICPGSASMGRFGSVNSIAAIYITDSAVLGADLIEV